MEKSTMSFNDILNLNDLWIIDNYQLNADPPCDVKKCNCHVLRIKDIENHKLLSSVFFGLLICGFRLDDKASNQFWINLMEKIKN